MGFKYKVSKTKAREFSQTMNEIDVFCSENFISRSNSFDSYYFSIGKNNYRVSNHSISKSDQGCFDRFGNKIRSSYHTDDPCLICITASKTRIIQIYNDLKNGYKLTKGGNRIL
jgi:hypothetical protein